MQIESIDLANLPSHVRKKIIESGNKLSKELAFNLALVESGLMYVIDEVAICEKFCLSIEQLHDFQRTQRDNIDRCKTELFLTRKMMEQEIRDRLKLASVGRNAILHDDPSVAAKIDAALTFSEKHLSMEDLKAMTEMLKDADSTPPQQPGSSVNITINSPSARAEEALARHKRQPIDVPAVKVESPEPLQLPESK